MLVSNIIIFRYLTSPQKQYVQDKEEGEEEEGVCQWERLDLLSFLCMLLCSYDLSSTAIKKLPPHNLQDHTTGAGHILCHRSCTNES